MTTPRPATTDPRPPVLLGFIVWLVLASSITLEQGQETAAQWGSATALIAIGLVALLAVGRVALIPLRAVARRVRRRGGRTQMRPLTQDLAAVAGLAAAVVASLLIVRVTTSEPEPTTASPPAPTMARAMARYLRLPVRGSSSTAASPTGSRTTTTKR